MIKKMISAAALIAAGTALASADTWTTVVETDSDYVLEKGRVTLGELGVTDTYDYASYSWCISFTLDVSTSRNGGKSAFTTTSYNDADNNGVGLEILVNTTNGVINIANANGVHLGDPDSNADATVFTVGGGDLDLSLSWDALAKTMTLTVSQTSGVSGYTTTLDLLSDEESAEKYIQYASLTPDSTLWTHSGDEQDGDSFATPISNVVVQVQQVPEPSMFGVLAGLGALGLVATRRRRNRKA